MNRAQKRTVSLIVSVFMILSVFAGSFTTVQAAQYTERSILAGGKAWKYHCYSDHAELWGVRVSGTSQYPESLVVPDYTPSELGSLPVTYFNGLGTGHDVNTVTKSITLNKFITEIPYEAFGYCWELEKFSFGKAPVTKIADNAFADTKISSITFPASLKTIGAYAFSGAPVKNLVLPKGVKTIGEYAFSCEDVRQAAFTIPDSVTQIGNYAFEGRNVGKLYVGKGIRTLDVRKWFGPVSINNVTGCNNVTTIQTYPYAGMKSITIYKNVKKISKDALELSSLKKCPVVTIKSKKLKKSGIKRFINAAYNGKIKKVTFKVKVGSKSQNKKYVKRYKKFLTRKNVLDWTNKWDLKHLKKIVSAV